VSDHMQVHHRFTGGKSNYLVPKRLFILPVPIQRGRPPTVERNQTLNLELPQW
jgi:hypothetical protein